MTRREARIQAMQTLYLYDFDQTSIESALDAVSSEGVEEQVVSFVMNCFQKLDQIDKMIEASLENYSLDRLNLVDKAIIRLAVSEMLGDQPHQIIINEALEITKEFTDQGDHKATSFNNRLLDKISKSLSR